MSLKRWFRESAYAVPVFTLIIVLPLLLGAWVTMSHFEAKVYNEITGENISTFQAMFVQLRVTAIKER
jgi:isoprenylcysteine carboxyl methyltransferase (ICMT) family protein YpbQ